MYVIYSEKEASTYNKLKESIIFNTIAFDHSDIDTIIRYICINICDSRGKGRQFVKAYMIMYIYAQIGREPKDKMFDTLESYIDDRCIDLKDELKAIYDDCMNFMYDISDVKELMGTIENSLGQLMEKVKLYENKEDNPLFGKPYVKRQ